MSSSQTVRRSVCAASDRAMASTEGRKPPGKMSRLAKPGRVLLGLVGAVVGADGLQEHEPVGRQQRRAAGEEGVEVLPADRLDHLDRGQAVVGPLQLAVVLPDDPYAVVQPGALDAGLGVGALLGRDRRRGHARAVLGRGVHGQAAPAAADLEQVRVRPSASARQTRSTFARWAVLERVVGVRVQPARVDHEVAVEEELEEVVAEVVVGGDVAPGAGDRVAERVRAQPAQRPAQAAQHAPRANRAAHLERARCAAARRRRASPTGRRRRPRPGRRCRRGPGERRRRGRARPRCRAARRPAGPKPSVRPPA